MWLLVFLLVCALGANGVQRNQYGPDPWDVPSSTEKEPFIPPDISFSLPPKRTNNDPAPVGDYFFRRLLIIVLKNGAIKTEEDGSKEISIAMKLTADKWKVLEEFVKSEKPLTEDMYRRTVGYVSDAIFKPSFTEKVVQAWSEYVASYYYFYREEMTWMITILSIVLSMVFLSKYMSMSKLLWIVLFIVLYLYEGLLSYKEFEKQDYEQFVSAVSRCKWHFWSSSCDVPMSDPLAFWKHMHPSKITVRMIGHFITEPLLIVSSSVNVISNQITRDLWPPFNSILNGILIFLFNIVCIVLIVLVVFTYILKMPFNISFLAGLIHFGVNKQETHNVPSKSRNNSIHTGDRISGENLNKLISILSRTQVPMRNNDRAIDIRPLHSAREARNAQRTPALLHRSHSAGRISERNTSNGIAS